ncbi:transcription factor bHLH128-like isoform X2 [Wolffia australiana]
MNMSQPGGGFPGRRPAAPASLTRFGSAPSSLLAALADSAGDTHFSETMAGNFFSDGLPSLSSESSCGNKRKSSGLGLDLIRHRSSPPGFLSHLLVDNGFGGDTYPALKPQLSFSSRQGSFSQISELGVPEMGEANSSDVSSGGLAWDEGSSGDIIANLGNIESNQFEMEKLFRLQQDSVPCKIRAKRGCATHPRSIAERERRTRISEKLKKLEDIVPDVDKIFFSSKRAPQTCLT